MRLTPIGGDATLLNMSWSGLLARCATRVAPGMAVKITFEGTFTPSTIDGRVARCEVAGIARNGAIQYNIGIAFNQPITLPDDEETLSTDVPAAAAAGPSSSPVTLRNRW
jgi:hypothetical protein